MDYSREEIEKALSIVTGNLLSSVDDWELSLTKLYDKLTISLAYVTDREGASSDDYSNIMFLYMLKTAAQKWKERG